MPGLSAVTGSYGNSGKIEPHSCDYTPLGPLGLFAVAMSVRSGVSQVIAIGGPPHRLEVAQGWGAPHILDVGEMDASERQEQIRDWTDEQELDVVIEVSGTKTAVPLPLYGFDLELLSV